MVLVDTSVWIEVFARPSRLDLKSQLELDEIVTCLPVVQEVLQGFRNDSAFRLARDAVVAFPIVESPLVQEVFEEAVALYRNARRDRAYHPIERRLPDCCLCHAARSCRPSPRPGLCIAGPNRTPSVNVGCEATDEARGQILGENARELWR